MLRSASLRANIFSRNIVYSDHWLVSNQGVFDIDRGSGFKHSCTCGIDQRTAKIPAKEMKRFTAATVVKRLQQRKIFLRTRQRQPNSYHPHPQETRVSSGNVRLYGCVQENMFLSAPSPMVFAFFSPVDAQLTQTTQIQFLGILEQKQANANYSQARVMYSQNQCHALLKFL